MNSSRPRILQIFNRYLEYGGEQASVFRIGDTLQNIADVEYFSTSSEGILGSGGVVGKLKFAAVSMHNAEVVRRLRRYQAVGRFDLWQVHNVFPTMSPSVYSMAFKRGIPIIQYLHNYRMSCVNGMFLNHGETCISCIHGNFSKAARTGCWRNSRAASGWMGLVLMRLRALGVLEKVAAWIALSDAQKELHVEMGIPEKKIHVIPHFFDIDESRFIEESGEDVLFIGRLSKEKGVDRLLDAWKQVERGDATLLIGGDGAERESLERKVQEEGIRNVNFLGFVTEEQKAELWKKAAFSVVPSIWQEPFGLVALEAWERGRTLIVSDVGGLADIVEDGVDGLKVRMGDIESWACAITKMLGNATLRRAMVEKGRTKLREQFCRDIWFERITRIYDEVLKK